MAKRTRPTVTLKCSKCGHEETHEGKTELSAYNYAMQKHGWGAVGLDAWLCDICWDQMPDKKMEAV